MCSNCKQPTPEALGSKNIDEPTSESMWPFFLRADAALAWKWRQDKHRPWRWWTRRRNHKAPLSTNFHLAAQTRLAWSRSFFFCCCSYATVKTAILFLTTVLVEAPSERFNLVHEPHSVSVVKLWSSNRHYSDVRFHRVQGSIAELFQLW